MKILGQNWMRSIARQLDQARVILTSIKKLFQVIVAILALALAISNEFEGLGDNISGETPQTIIVFI